MLFFAQPARLPSLKKAKAPDVSGRADYLKTALTTSPARPGPSSPPRLLPLSRPRLPVPRTPGSGYPRSSDGHVGCTTDRFQLARTPVSAVCARYLCINRYGDPWSSTYGSASRSLLTDAVRGSVLPRDNLFARTTISFLCIVLYNPRLQRLT